MAEKPDYYAVLGPPAKPGCSDDDVQRAFRRRALILHPDVRETGDEDAYKEAVAARDALETQALRDAYDEGLVLGRMDDAEFEEDEDADAADVLGGAAPKPDWTSLSGPQWVSTVVAHPTIAVGYFNRPLSASDKALAVIGGLLWTPLAVLGLMHLGAIVRAIESMAGLPPGAWIVLVSLLGAAIYGLLVSRVGFIVKWTAKGILMGLVFGVRAAGVYLKLSWWLVRHVWRAVRARRQRITTGP